MAGWDHQSNVPSRAAKPLKKLGSATAAATTATATTTATTTATPTATAEHSTAQVDDWKISERNPFNNQRGHLEP